jgi:hypothetical protein
MLTAPYLARGEKTFYFSSVVEHIPMGLFFSTSFMQESTFRPQETITSLREMTKNQLVDSLLDGTDTDDADYGDYLRHPG